MRVPFGPEDLAKRKEKIQQKQVREWTKQARKNKVPKEIIQKVVNRAKGKNASN